MKYCTQCGAGNIDEAVFCAQCGARLASNQLGSSQPVIGPVPDVPPVPDIPQHESFGENRDKPNEAPAPSREQTPPEQTVYAQPAAAYPAAPAVDKGNSVLWLVLNIVLAVLCCCTVLGILGSVCAIIGIVFAGMSISKANQGFSDTARQYEKTAMILFFVALGLAIVSIIAVIASGVLSNIDFYSNLIDYYY